MIRARARPDSSSSRRTPSVTTSRASRSTPPSGTTARAAGRSTDPTAQIFLDKCKELGIKNVHAHKGPTIWPLDKDAFDIKDIDVAATSNPELNFIVEHVGLPRIEDFCFMATQEPNVYAGLAVVIGGLMHARPRFFAKVMGELLFWVGEDKMLFGSDYAIWEPKWQVEGFIDWTDARHRGVLGLPAPHDRDQEEDHGAERGQAVRHRGPGRAPAARTAALRRRRRTRSWSSRHDAYARRRRACSTRSPRSTTRSWTSRSPRLGFVTSCEVSADGDVEVVLRLPTPQCAPNFAFLMAADARTAVRRLPGVREVTIRLEDHYTGAEINAALGRGEGFTGAFPGETADDDLAALRELFLRKALVARPVAAVRGAAGERAQPRGGRVRAASGTCRTTFPTPGGASSSGGASAWITTRASPAFVLPERRAAAGLELKRWLRTARLVRMSLEVNGGICRSLLRVHRGVEIDDPEEVSR